MTLYVYVHSLLENKQIFNMFENHCSLELKIVEISYASCVTSKLLCYGFRRCFWGFFVFILLHYLLILQE